LPQYDEVFPRIAQRVENCQFIFICSHINNWVTEQVRLRLYKIFSQFGLRADDHVIFLPRFEKEQYHAINYIADIFLDSIGWSGCNSTLEAVACNLPIVTLPGALMRGRHSSAILAMMGMRDTIAKTLDDYIEIGVRLGTDSGWRKYISERIASSKHLVYKDKACIKAIEDFIERAVNRRQG
jgi:predicted O-linked N-acetylglucosamine transferase (SPINDLY family)